jgi:ABC-type antimicrobial peptide transport system permease subunit
MINTIGNPSISPNAFKDSTYTTFVIAEEYIDKTVNSLTQSEQLYTINGNQAIILGNPLKLAIGVGRGTDSIVTTTSTVSSVGGSGSGSSSPFLFNSNLVVQSLLSSSAGFRFSRTLKAYDIAYTSFPTHIRMVSYHCGGSFENQVGVQRVSANLVRKLWSKLSLNETMGTGTGIPAFKSCLLQNAAPGNGYSANTNAFVSSLIGTSAAGGAPARLPPVLLSSVNSISVQDVPLGTMYVGFNDGTDAAASSNSFAKSSKVSKNQQDRLLADITKTFLNARRARLGVQDEVGFTDNGGFGVSDMRNASNALASTVLLLQYFFAFLALIAMVLCFFSLLASMISNVNEQVVEISVMRAIGLMNFAIHRLFIEEALLVVLTASLMGIGVGSFVAWTFGQQQSLFTGIPSPFVPPVGILVVVIGASAVLATVAAWAPVRRVVKQEVVKGLRGG